MLPCLKDNTSRVYDQHHVFTRLVFNATQMKTVGERIRQARDYRGLTAQELAVRVGYTTQSGISNLENRAVGRGGYKLPQIAEQLNFSLEWFLQGPDTEDMSRVAPFQSHASYPTQEDQTAQKLHQTQPPYNSPRDQAHRIIDLISEKGLVHAIELLEGLAQRHPIDKTERAGLPIPAQARNVA